MAKHKAVWTLDKKNEGWVDLHFDGNKQLAATYKRFGGRLGLTTPLNYTHYYYDVHYDLCDENGKRIQSTRFDEPISEDELRQQVEMFCLLHGVTRLAGTLR